MTSVLPQADPPLVRHAPFQHYFWGRALSQFSEQIATVAIGWQVYAKTNSAFALGLVGLMQFAPSALLLFVGGHVADRFDRRRIILVCQVIQAFVALYLAYGSWAGWIGVPQILASVVIFGIAGAFEGPAKGALLPAVVPSGSFQKGAALSTAAAEVAVLSGPALGGLLYALSPAAPYALMTLFWLGAGVLNGTIRLERTIEEDEETPTVDGMFAGVAFVRAKPVLLGTMSLDLLAVLLGGATALLPIYARDILHTGPWGLGVLRSAPAIGALAMTALLTRHAFTEKVGMRLFQSIILFGGATIIFAVSHVMWLSLLALVVMGAADTMSMVIRNALVQLTTPDGMRGRVGAVKSLFVDASNQLGEFESGVTAALFGTVPAALIGGIGTILVALLWMAWFPALRRIERLE